MLPLSGKWFLKWLKDAMPSPCIFQREPQNYWRKMLKNIVTFVISHSLGTANSIWGAMGLCSGCQLFPGAQPWAAQLQNCPKPDGDIGAEITHNWNALVLNSSLMLLHQSQLLCPPQPASFWTLPNLFGQLLLLANGFRTSPLPLPQSEGMVSGQRCVTRKRVSPAWGSALDLESLCMMY